MTDETDETTRACLHRFEAKLDQERIAGDECSEERIVTVENRVSALDQHMTSIHLDDRAIRQQLDQILVRLQRLERRVGLLDDEMDDLFTGSRSLNSLNAAALLGRIDADARRLGISRTAWLHVTANGMLERAK
jgi:chromosome segregation ATPase